MALYKIKHRKILQYRDLQSFSFRKRERMSVQNLPLQLGLGVKALETTLIMALVLLLCVTTAVTESLIGGLTRVRGDPTY